MDLEAFDFVAKLQEHPTPSPVADELSAFAFITATRKTVQFVSEQREANRTKALQLDHERCKKSNTDLKTIGLLPKPVHQPNPITSGSSKKRKQPLLQKGEKLTRGAPKRHRPSLGARSDVVRRLQELLAPPGTLSAEDRHKLGEYNGKARLVVLHEFPWLGQSQLTQWSKPAAMERVAAQLRGKTKGGGRGRKSARKIKGWGGRPAAWPREEATLFGSVKSRRERGFKVKARFVKAEMRKLVKAGNPNNPKAQRFKASNGWLRRFMKRFNLTWRRRSNKKPFVAAKYEPGVRVYLDGLRKLRMQKRSESERLARLEKARESGGEAAVAESIAEHELYGLLTPDVTFNVDQVPLPFAVNDEITMDIVGTERVWIKQLGSGLDKRQCTLQLCIRARGEQPKPCLIFRGSAKKRTPAQKKEMKQYDSDVIVLWQGNAWADGDVCVKWAGIHAKFSPTDFPCNNPTKLLLVDSLQAQVARPFVKAIERSNTVVRQGVTKATDIWQPVDAGIGHTYQRLIGSYYDDWLESADAVQYMERGSIPVEKRRILMTQW